MNATSVTLTKGGYVASFPRKVANGPLMYGGLTMRPLWAEQVIQQVQTMMKHLRCRGDGQSMLQINLAWAQLSTGMGFPIFDDTTTKLPHLEDALFSSIRDGLNMVQGSIDMVDTYVIRHR
jgi:hypothetical protein